MPNQTKEMDKDLYRTDTRGKVHRNYDKGFSPDADKSPRVAKDGGPAKKKPASGESVKPAKK